jgi:TonB family protein
MRVAGGGAALLLPASLTACGNEEERKVKSLKQQVEVAYGSRDFAKALDLSQKGLALARKAMGDTSPDAVYFAVSISKNQEALHNIPALMRALKQEITLRTDTGQKEKKIQPRRTLLIQLAEQNGDTPTAIDQTVIIAKSLEMGTGKDPQPTYRPMPDYPPDLYRSQVEGDVEIAFNLDPDGSPTGVRVTKSTPPNVFDSLALDSFRKWRFTPYIENDEPVASTGHHFTVAFRLSRSQ